MPRWQIDEEFVVEITGLSHEGAGVGRIDGRVVFVPDSLPGELIKIRLAEIRKRYALGELLEVMKSSPERVEPGCPHARLCGGCQLQHLSYQGQLKWKRQMVQDAIERIGGLDLQVRPVIGMDHPYEYRNNTQLALGTAAGQLTLGFYQKESHDIVNLATCQIQHPLATKLALALREIASGLGIASYDRVKNTGVLKHAMIRVSFTRNELMLVLITRTPDLPRREQLISSLVREVPELVSIAHNVNPRPGKVLLGKKTKTIWGKPHLVETIGGLDYAISPASFFQVNPRQTELLYDLIKDKMPLTGTETILDLYCGAGTIGLYLAKQARQVIGVEIVEAAVDDARRNAELNGIGNAEFVQGKAEQKLPQIVKKQHIDGVILDPPRKGCESELLEMLSTIAVPNIMYVSCNPATLARDLAVLKESGYFVGEVQPIDMFPWTNHVEVAILMTYCGSKEK